MPNMKSRGFTLIELMVVVAIIAILASVAYPQYAKYVRKARRADAMSNLKSAQLQLEKWRVDHSTYAGATTGLPAASAYYTYTLTGATATDYTLGAAAQGDQVKDPCGNLSIVKAGVSVQNKTSTNAASCW